MWMWPWKGKYNYSIQNSHEKSLCIHCVIQSRIISTSERPTIIRMSVSSSVPAPFMAAFRRRAKYSCGFLAHRTVQTETNHSMKRVASTKGYQIAISCHSSLRSLLWTAIWLFDSKERTTFLRPFQILNSLGGYSYPEWCNSPLMFL